MNRFIAQWRAELRVVVANPEQLLVTLGIPLLLVVFFSRVDVLPTGDAAPIDFLAPGVIALAVMSTAMVSLGISTGFQRSYRVLKRLGATPLGRGRLLGAKVATIAAVEVVQFAVLVPVALALGWSPTRPNWLAALGAVIVGTMAFAGLGLTLAGRLRAEVNLAAQNGLYLLLLLLGGMIISVDELPAALRAVALALPSGALADVLRESLAHAGTRPGVSWVILAAWALSAPAVAALSFRWE